MSKQFFRLIPSVNDLLADQDVSGLMEDYPRTLVLQTLNILLEELREKIRMETVNKEDLQTLVSSLPGKLSATLQSIAAPTLKPVINATGIIIYTNLGRAPISRKIAEEFTNTICCYSNLEYEIEKGSRGHRDVHFESRITRLMGCEAASVCNNAAAALLIILNTLAHDKNVIISRGELVEIGGSFRIPEILKKSGAQLREIGTTNRTFLRDYENAIDKDTALILKVHTGNYRITGFTSEAGLAELAELAASRDIPLVHDAGSGLLFPSEDKCLENEPSIRESLDAGADLVCFSGDKLLGGPQAGIIVGKRKYVSLIRRNSLMRALRIDKVICSLLDRTMLEYEMGREEANIPVRKFIAIPAEEIEKRAEVLVARISNPDLHAEIKPGFSKSGGGSSPGGEIPTALVALNSSRFSAASIERHLRSREIPILARIEKELVLIDLRTVFPVQDEIILKAINSLNS